MTNVLEQHANSFGDNSIFDAQVRQNQDTIVSRYFSLFHTLPHERLKEHGTKEKVVIDKGTNVHESVQHHIHHVVQPVVEEQCVYNYRSE